MKSLEYVKENIDSIELDQFIDRRFTNRFLDYIPVSEWNNYGFEFAGKELPQVKEWTEENILAQLKADVKFGIEKATGHRGISSELMFLVCKSWCMVLENGLDKIEYEDCCYGDKLFKEIDKMYNFGLVDESTFDKEFYEEW